VISYQDQRQFIGNLLSGTILFLAKTLQKFLQRFFPGKLGGLRFCKFIAAVFNAKWL